MGYQTYHDVKTLDVKNTAGARALGVVATVHPGIWIAKWIMDVPLRYSQCFYFSPKYGRFRRISV